MKHALDPHLAALTGEYGPFSRCSPNKHTEPRPLPVEPAPTEVLAQLPQANAAWLMEQVSGWRVPRQRRSPERHVRCRGP
ncbi:DUF4913 domain-containing protein [Micromonospora sp. NPDC047812]|uniref:DUF4913 domain-containing protein n=1 Tax=Micromonospora sp. NPDC047812 TaxID=3155742 RepID=UPI0034532C6A